MAEESERPRVVGGVLVEAVGGPFDGDLLYLPDRKTKVDVHLSDDPTRAPTVSRVRHNRGPSWIGWYDTRGHWGGSAYAAWWCPALAPSSAEGRDG